VKASSRKTPQPTPAALSEASTKQQLTGTTQRISTLRRDCLIRDRHQCVISRRFDRDEALQRVKRDSEDAKDDDGRLLKDESERSTALEVAHILPHSLTSAGGGSQLVCY
jgi:5-methylcytosine-specific restriction endonuclease McrA